MSGGCFRRHISYFFIVGAAFGKHRAVPFAGIDPTLDHLKHEQRTMVEKMSGRLLSLREALQATYDTVQESPALLARSRGKPYLASRFGKRTIRDRTGAEGAP